MMGADLLQHTGLATILTILLALLFAFFARTLAGFLAQNKWSPSINEGIADGFILIFMLLNGLVVVHFGDIALIAGPLDALITGWVAKNMVPLKKWSLLLQGNVFVFEGGRFHFFLPTTSPYDTSPSLPAVELPPLPALSPTQTPSEDRPPTTAVVPSIVVTGMPQTQGQDTPQGTPEATPETPSPQPFKAPRLMLPAKDTTQPSTDWTGSYNEKSTGAS